MTEFNDKLWNELLATEDWEIGYRGHPSWRDYQLEPTDKTYVKHSKYGTHGYCLRKSIGDFLMLSGPGINEWFPVTSVKGALKKVKESWAKYNKVIDCKCLVCSTLFTNTEWERTICDKCRNTKKAFKLCKHKGPFMGNPDSQSYCEDCFGQEYVDI